MNLFFKNTTQNTSCIWGGRSAWHTGAQNSSEHLWETAISHSWGYYWGTWLELNMLILTFIEVNIATELWGPILKVLLQQNSPSAEGGACPSTDEHIGLGVTGQEEWLNCCVHQQQFQLTLVGFLVGFESLMTWQTCEVFIVDAGILPAPFLAFPCDWDRWVWHMQLKIVLPLKAKRLKIG